MSKRNKSTVYEILGRDAVHPFPARMAPGIALDQLANAQEQLSVLDPMAGSGTVLAVARSMGHRAMGVDIDPLAVLASRVWTTPIDVEAVRAKALEVLARARLLFDSLAKRDAYPRNSDEETRKFARYWFDDYARRQVAALATAIERVRSAPIRDALWCAFSRLIISKQAGASLALDLSHSRPHRWFETAPAKPFRMFLAAVDRVVDNCIAANARRRGPAARVFEGDARALPIGDSSVDLVLTSPPYLNAIDYMRCSKFSLVWMGHTAAELRGLRGASVGTEVGRDAAEDDELRAILGWLGLRPKLRPRDEAVLRRYIDDMRRSLAEVGRVLRDDGRAVYVIGENTIRGTYVRNAKIIEAVAGLAGLECVERRSRRLPANRRYLPPPSAGSVASLGTRMRREVVLTFQKT